MRPGVMECGCLWDGRLLTMDGCPVAPDDHGLGRVPFMRDRLSIGGQSLAQIEWPVVRPNGEPKGWPDPDAPWLWG